jgi:Uma2 family endonuclease
MASLAEPLLMTVGQFDLLPERQDAQQELHWGYSVTFSRPKPWHVKLQMKLTQLLQPLADVRGYIVMELPFRAVSEYDVRAADVAFVTKERWDDANEGYLPGSPELVIEILSPSNTKTQIREYAALCLSNGCEEFWAVDYTKKSVTVTNKNGRSIEYSAGMEVPTPLFGAASVAVDVIFG